MQKSESKNNRGITLIALVITIIVLLILAEVTIATLTGDNGILTKATEAKQKTMEATAKEKVQIEVMASYGTDGKIKEKITLQTAKQNEMLNNAENSYINLTDGLVVIQAGFKVAEDSGTTIDEGIVVMVIHIVVPIM